MKLALLAILLWGSLAAQTPQPLQGTISNPDKEEAPYIPDDSLPYAASHSSERTVVPVLLVPVLFAPVPVVAPVYDAGFIGGGYAFHPRPATRPATISHASRGRR